MASVKYLLENTLMDLVNADLKWFQQRLEDDHKCISKSEMENADRLKTVNKMVECFGREEAVKIMVGILRKINQNELAEQLENEHKQVSISLSFSQLRLRELRTHLSLLELIQIKPQLRLRELRTHLSLLELIQIKPQSWKTS
ncbi:LRR and PYD domains-containing 6-like protein [Labeo rohita]|uniref:LRR and PYD domains-containing 6-like protein n=1 Tax=Labeo rohita TaxID=84645 RepID=A0A498MF41_LABRO|nr:LRR and PYD domains-containing 6-like protein [Labeo rohita]